MSLKDELQEKMALKEQEQRLEQGKLEAIKDLKAHFIFGKPLAVDDERAALLKEAIELTNANHWVQAKTAFAESDVEGGCGNQNRDGYYPIHMKMKSSGPYKIMFKGKMYISRIPYSMIGTETKHRFSIRRKVAEAKEEIIRQRNEIMDRDINPYLCGDQHYAVLTELDYVLDGDRFYRGIIIFKDGSVFSNVDMPEEILVNGEERCNLADNGPDGKSLGYTLKIPSFWYNSTALKEKLITWIEPRLNS